MPAATVTHVGIWDSATVGEFLCGGSLSASKTVDAGDTLTIRRADIAKVTQVIKQLEKFTEVISAKELDTNKSYWREAAIVKLEIDCEHLKTYQDRFNFEMLEKKNRDIQIIQVAGSTAQIDTFLDEIGRENIIEIARTGISILMVEQNARQALEIADKGYVLVQGRNAYTGTGKELLADPEVRKSFLGG